MSEKGWDVDVCENEDCKLYNMRLGILRERDSKGSVK